MTLSLNEIKKRAIEFAREWQHEKREHAEAQSFWNDFFNVFGISRRMASFEEPVKKLGNKRGRIDLFWKGVVLVEHKSAGKDLNEAYTQAMDYFPGLKDYELPKYILVSDFQHFKLYDLEEKQEHQFTIAGLHNQIHLFTFMTGYAKKVYKDEDPVNIEAAELMGKLHDALLDNGYEGHKLEVLLVRVLFCLFAEDTAIFEKNAFRSFIEEYTREDGSDLGTQLAQLFEILDTPETIRQKNLPEVLLAFPYVNGSIFSEFLPFPSFDTRMRESLIRCTYFDWSRISPAIFGSLFQSVTDQVKRRNLGAHYTSEKNILKVIRGLFLDELYQELESVKNNSSRLAHFHNRIAKLKFLDPSCGCGNFLVITYRELRLLELQVLKAMMAFNKDKNQTVDLSLWARINIDAVYGIDIEEFPARVAEVAIYLIDHQMNMRLSEEFGNLYVRLPLRKAAGIVHGNALRLDWESLVPRHELNYILGNPPFLGKQNQSKLQSDDLDFVCAGDIAKSGLLDFVCGWYVKAARYIQDTHIKVAFVSTNSVTQGEQVGVLWQYMLNMKTKILFAHRTFKWTNEARHTASVYCVIIGFYHNHNAEAVTPDKFLYDYQTPTTEPLERKVKNINPYLVDYDDVLILNRTKPLCNVPEMMYGSKPNEGGNFLFTDEEKEQFLNQEPEASKFIKPAVSGREFINGEKRWALWLKNIQPTEIKKLKHVAERIDKVKQLRLKSTKGATVKLAEYAHLFGEIRQPENDYVVIPRVSSENRRYIPIGFLTKNYILTDTCVSLPNATLYHFGMIVSTMHMAWMRQICGRLKSDYRYSNALVYNNFPFPENVPSQKIANVEAKAQQVLRVRERYPNESLATLYDPLSMPADLVKAHNDLDKAVDECYSPKPFDTELKRLEFLFDLYRKYSEPLLLAGQPRKKAKATQEK